MPRAYYNEFDPYAAQWLRNLIAAGHIAPGDVDQRSIEDVAPLDLAGFTQCHFFAGVGVWSLALRRAGWPDSRPVWTGSCPCQPFSAAGKGNGFADERHLWPAWHHLIGQRSPIVVFGEQVSSKDADIWVDLVQTDMEALGYAFGAVPFPSAGIGAPHIRDRLYWLADTHGNGSLDGKHGANGRSTNPVAECGSIDRMADANDARLEGFGSGYKTEGGRFGEVRPTSPASESCRVEYATGDGREQRGTESGRGSIAAGCTLSGLADSIDSTGHGSQPRGIIRELPQGVGALQTECRPTGPVNGRWSDADWLFCRDGKWRPVESRPQPLVDGSAESLGRVRPGTLEEIEGEINASSMESQIRRPEVLRALQDSLISQAQRCWATGRLPQLHEAPFLLAFLRQLQAQGWAIAQDKTLLRQETSGANVRMLRNDSQIAGAPCEHGLDGQSPGEYPDPVHFLSSLLARHAHSAWGHAYETYAEIGFPLHHKARSRVGRLRAYGNAINAEAAEAWIRAYMECRP